MEQLSCIKCLRHSMHKVQSCHQIVRHFGIKANHLRMIKRVDEAEHMADGGEIDIGAWLVRLRLQSKAHLVPVLHHVLAQEVDRIAHTLDRYHRVLPGICFGTFTSTPEDIGGCAQFGTQVNCSHRLLQGKSAYRRIVRGESSIFENRMEEEVRRCHWHDHAIIRERLLELAHNAVTLGRRCIEGNKVVIMQIDAPGPQFREFLHDVNWIKWRANELAEGVASPVADCPESKAKFILFPRGVLVAGPLTRFVLRY